LDHYFFPSEPRASRIEESPRPANPQSINAQATSPLPPEKTSFMERAHQQLSVKNGYSSFDEVDALLKKWTLPSEKK